MLTDGLEREGDLLPEVPLSRPFVARATGLEPATSGVIGHLGESHMSGVCRSLERVRVALEERGTRELAAERETRTRWPYVSSISYLATSQQVASARLHEALASAERSPTVREALRDSYEELRTAVAEGADGGNG